MANIITKDFGWDRISKEIRKMDNSFTKTGFPENAEVKPPTKKIKGQKVASNMSEVATIAAFNNFGTKQAISTRSGATLINIPAREFMGSSLDENMKGLNTLRNKLYIKVTNGEMTTKQALSIIGEYMTTKIKMKIRDLKTPPNSPSTIKKKGSSNPLIDSGQMINSVTHVEEVK